MFAEGKDHCLVASNGSTDKESGDRMQSMPGTSSAAQQTIDPFSATYLPVVTSGCRLVSAERNHLPSCSGLFL